MHFQKKKEMFKTENVGIFTRHVQPTRKLFNNDSDFSNDEYQRSDPHTHTHTFIFLNSIKIYLRPCDIAW